jgi:hypothetical protein
MSPLIFILSLINPINAAEAYSIKVHITYHLCLDLASGLFPCLYGTRRFIIVLISVLNQMNPINKLARYFIMIHFSVNLPSVPTFQSSLFPSALRTNIVRMFLFFSVLGLFFLHLISF